MSSETYWKEREAKNLAQNQLAEEEYSRRLKAIYQNQLDAIQKEIDGFYGKYADSEGITIAEAKKRVSKLDIEAYERKAARYVAEKNFSEKANEEMRLYNATMKINRLELLKANIGLELIAGHEELDRFMEEILQGRTEDELKRQAGILGKTVQQNAKTASSIVNASFQNATFSDRIWMYQDALKNELASTLQSGLIQGKNPRELARTIRQRFDVQISNAERLMRTELARVQTDAQKRSLEENGFEEYEFIANGNCCPICDALDGKHFNLRDLMPGKNAPPMHPNCRCSTAAYEDDEEYRAWLDYLANGGSTEEWNTSGRTEWLIQKSGQKSVEKDLVSGIIESGAISGALTDKNDPLYVKRDRHAYTYYESVRNSKKSPVVKSISKSSGFSERYISKVYDHVFINEYDLHGGKKRFEPDYDMAESFRRLREGRNIQKHDIILLKHEHLEYGLMNRLGIPYDKAHDLAQSKYDYASALENFKRENNL